MGYTIGQYLGVILLRVNMHSQRDCTALTLSREQRHPLPYAAPLVREYTSPEGTIGLTEGHYNVTEELIAN